MTGQHRRGGRVRLELHILVYWALGPEPYGLYYVLMHAVTRKRTADVMPHVMLHAGAGAGCLGRRNPVLAHLAKRSANVRVSPCPGIPRSSPAGLRHSVPSAHSVLLSAVFGPLGVISNYLTRVRRMVQGCTARFRTAAVPARVAPGPWHNLSRSTGSHTHGSNARIVRPPSTPLRNCPIAALHLIALPGPVVLFLRHVTLSPGSTPGPGKSLPRQPPDASPSPRVPHPPSFASCVPSDTRRRCTAPCRRCALPSSPWWCAASGATSPSCRTRSERGAVLGTAAPDRCGECC